MSAETSSRLGTLHQYRQRPTTPGEGRGRLATARGSRAVEAASGRVGQWTGSPGRSSALGQGEPASFITSNFVLSCSKSNLATKREGQESGRTRKKCHGQYHVLMRMWGDRNSPTLLEEKQNGSAPLEKKFGNF